jgi:serine/threonine protein kinase
MTDSAVWKGGVEPLPVERAQNVFQQLVRGISYLHHMGVLHRDIKPSNVLGNREHGVVKVSDFGVSSFTKVQKSARVLGEDDIITVGSCGTPAFLPPEASGAGFDVVYHGRPADVWSLGVTFYVLLCGHLPFRGENRVSTAKLICEQKLKIPSHVPSAAKELITKMLEKDPTRRASLVWVSNHPWIDAGNWKADLSEQDLSNPGQVSQQELQYSLSKPQSLRKTMKKRSQSFIKMSGSFMKSILQSPSGMIRPADVTGKVEKEAEPWYRVLWYDPTLFFQPVTDVFCCAGDRVQAHMPLSLDQKKM